MIKKNKNTNELTTIDPFRRVTNVAEFIDKIGTDIAKSGIWKCDFEATGRVLALEVFASRTPPLSLARRFEFISGRLSMKADAMLADLVDIGGDYEIHSHTPEECDVTFISRTGKRKFRLKITWEMAQEEKWPFIEDRKTKEKTLKGTWATPIGRQDMLWARVVSRGVRRVEPGVVAGKYTPEEMADFIPPDSEYAEFTLSVDGEGNPSGEIVVLAGESSRGGELLPQSAPVEDTRDEPARDGGTTPAQTEAIRRLYETLSIPLAKQEEILAKRNVNALRSLTAEQADELIAKLQQMVDASRVSPEATSVDVDGPIDQTLIDQIKEQISVAAQTGMPGLADDIKKLLTESGLNRLADLTVHQGQVMLQAIVERNLQIWATNALKPVAT